MAWIHYAILAINIPVTIFFATSVKIWTAWDYIFLGVLSVMSAYAVNDILKEEDVTDVDSIEVPQPTFTPREVPTVVLFGSRDSSTCKYCGRSYLDRKERCPYCGAPMLVKQKVLVEQ